MGLEEFCKPFFFSVEGVVHTFTKMIHKLQLYLLNSNCDTSLPLGLKEACDDRGCRPNKCGNFHMGTSM